MSSPLGLTTLTSGFISSTTQSQTADKSQNTGYTYNGYNFKKYSSAPNVKNAKQSIFSGGSTAFKTKFEHSDDVYDLRTTSIIKYCNNPQTPAMKIKAEDFAYLRNLGVYSNNRLIVVRRFPAPVGNDLTLASTSPMSTLISWIPDTEKNFMDVSFGEIWTDSDASLKKLLNDVGDDLSTGSSNKSSGEGKGAGSMLAGGLNALPLPGFMEGVQLRILKELGYTDNDANSIPSGNPNIIKEAKIRQTIPKDDKGSGLKCKVSIKFETEYEQKFIDGVDPTLVYLDVISTALRFGTSESRFIINTKLGGQGTDIINKIKSGKWIEAIKIFVDATIKAMKAIAADLIKTVTNGAQAVASAASSGSLEATANAIFDAFLKTAANTIISKYRIRLGGIMSALSGEASTPWHVTIGNPKKPVFSSGDMLVEEVQLDLGNTLSFNDLPSNIKISFTLTNARSLGAQEIFERFNCGAGRTYGSKLNKFEELETPINKKQ